MSVSRLGVGLLAIVVLGASSGAAHARPVASVSGSTLTIAGDGTAADLTIQPIGGGVEVVGASAGPGCTETAGGAACPTSGSTVLQATLSAAPETLRGHAPFQNATIAAGAGADTIVWTADTPATLRGGLDADQLTASGTGGGAVTLDGQAGNDRIQVGTRTSSADTIVGGADLDLVTYAGRTTPVTLTLDGTRNDGGLGENDLLGAGIERLAGGSADDRLTGDAANNTLDGGLGGDVIDGAGGRDTLSYSLTESRPEGVRVDRRSGSFPEGDSVSNIEDLTGSAGPDRLIGTSATETLNGGGGDDEIEGIDGFDTYIGGAGSDLVSFASRLSGIVVDLRGGSPVGVTFRDMEGAIGTFTHDLILGGPADEHLRGGGGDDVLVGGLGTDTFAGGFGRDTVSYEGDGRTTGGTIGLFNLGDNIDGGEVVPADVEVMRGSAFDDFIVGSVGAQRLEGAGGDDELAPGSGADEVSGGPGDGDSLLFGFSSAITSTSIRLTAGHRGSETVSGATWSGIEQLNGTVNQAADHVDASRDREANRLSFAEGDTVSYAGRTDGVTVTNARDADDGAVSEGDDVTAGIVEGTSERDTFDDTGLAALFSNRYIGGGGGDLFFATDAGTPDETPADAFDGGEGTDHLTWASDQPVRVVLAERRGSYNDELLGIENLTGGGGDDSLVGDDGPNTIIGGGGNDVMGGLGGADEFAAEPGADIYGGGNERDRIRYADATAGVRASPDNVADDGVAGEGDNVGADVESIFGSPLDDRLVAGNAAHAVFGEGGNDTLVAPAGGSPRLEGGPDVDTLDASGRVAPDGLTLTAGADTLAVTMFYKEVENLIGTSGPDVLNGDAGVNELRGGPGGDRLDGGPGQDVVLGGLGADAITDADADADQLGGSVATFGGGSLDEERRQADATAPTGTVSLSKIVRDDRLIVRATDPARRVIVNLAEKTTDLGDRVTDIESVTGTSGADTLIGDNAENTLGGGDGPDVIIGNGQNDRLSGGGGNDALRDGSAERDSVSGGAGTDSVDVLDVNPPTVGDAVDCGADQDFFSADLFDVVPASCEQALTFAPVRQHPMTRARALSDRVGRRGRVRVLVGCPRRLLRPACRGAVSLELGRLRRKEPRVLARKRYRLRPGQYRVFSLRLPRSARRLLASTGTLGIRVAARERDPQDRPRESSVPVLLRRR